MCSVQPHDTSLQYFTYNNLQNYDHFYHHFLSLLCVRRNMYSQAISFHEMKIDLRLQFLLRVTSFFSFHPFFFIYNVKQRRKMPSLRSEYEQINEVHNQIIQKRADICTK